MIFFVSTRQRAFLNANKANGAFPPISPPLPRLSSLPALPIGFPADPSPRALPKGPKLPSCTPTPGGTGWERTPGTRDHPVPPPPPPDAQKGVHAGWFQNKQLD